MKFIHILENINSGLDEAPMGLISRGIAKIGSAIPGTIGNQYSGEAQVGKIANDLYYEFYRFLGQIGSKPTGNAIKQFLKTKNTDADISRFLPAAPPSIGGLGSAGPDPANGPLSSSQVEKIFLGIVQDAARGGPPAEDAPPAPPVPPTPVPPVPPTGGRANVNDILTAIGNGTLKRRDLNRLKRKIDTILGTP
jgi:hypothetical protein